MLSQIRTGAGRHLLGFWNTAQRFAQVSGGRQAKLKVFLVAAWLSVRRRWPRLPELPFRIEAVRGGKNLSFMVGEYSDLEVMRELYLEGEYDVELPITPEVIFDAGANIGLAALDFRRRWPEAWIYAFEPDPSTFKRLEQNLHDDQQTTLRQIAIGERDEDVPFFRREGRWASSLRGQEDDGDPFLVKCRSLDSLMDEAGLEHVDLLKLDIEGAELEALRSFRGLPRVECVVGELHLDLIEDRPDDFLAAYLPSHEVTSLAVSGARATFAAVRRKP